VLKPLWANLDDCEATDGDPTRVVLLQEQFHRLLVEAAGNQTLTIFEEMIHRIIELHGRVYVAKHFDEPHATKTARIGTRAHRRFLELLVEQRHDEAAVLWERHLVEASDVVLRGADAKTVLELLN
jgi:DNA-binding GntR family transcriptional regulator